MFAVKKFGRGFEEGQKEAEAAAGAPAQVHGGSEAGATRSAPMGAVGRPACGRGRGGKLTGLHL